MTRGIEKVFAPPSAEDFEKYLFRKRKPSLDPSGLSLDLMVGEERRRLKSITGGDWSLVLGYKGKEAYLASFEENEDELRLTQLQGANSKRGYRVATGMDTFLFIADQVERIVTNPEAPYALLTMPPAILIAGIRDATENAIACYERAARRLRMTLSQRGDLFVRELR